MGKRDRPSKLSVGWTTARLAGRRLLRRSVGARDMALGERLADQLDQMKGLAMKLGQIASYMDVLPPAVQDKLTQLQAGVHGMDAQATRAAIETAFDKRPLGALFDSFDISPIAAASIGQVHRARFEGREVAVKLQYPDVAQSFVDDLGAVDRIASLASFASAVDGRAIVAELRARLVEECDYAREARMQKAFAHSFADAPAIVVPAIVEARCRPTVLTTAWLDGARFETFCQQADAAARQGAAYALVRFSYHSLLVLQTIQADPHPGNFLFLPSGAVGFVDFGCVRCFEPDFVAALRALIVALRQQDRARVADALDAVGLVGKPRRFDFDHAYAMMQHLYKPLLVDRFRFSAEYMREAMAFNGPRSPNARSMSISPQYLWVARLSWGLWAVLSRLEAEGSFAPLLDEILAQPPSALARRSVPLLDVDDL